VAFASDISLGIGERRIEITESDYTELEDDDVGGGPQGTVESYSEFSNEDLKEALDRNLRDHHV